ncbi:MAG TPA: DUF1015 domain-containing protein [Nocardioidaceae bacterium]|nr:DUF1015 domain-containing protein [Nocardioidaceae bacterium]
MTEDRRPFVLAPFRGLRFDPATVGDLGSVISPPYDVLDAETVRELEAANRRNIVRLILSRRFERPYEAVHKRLLSWRERGFLRVDPAPALYLYQYTVDDVTVRGLIGAAALRHPDERVILPHEDVMPGPVEDRKVLMRTTGTNLEPILLVHEGTAALRALLEQAADGPATASFTALDGSHHRLWALADPSLLEAFARELAETQALIADGHHRYAAYLALQGELRDPAADCETSPWDFGLAMLVDQHDYPLAVGPIHRSVAALTLADVQEASQERGDSFRTAPDRESAFADATAPDAELATFALSDGRAWAVVSTKRAGRVDAEVLHDELFDAWHVAEEQVGYHHSLDQALHTTARQPGLVVALRAPTVRQVMEFADQGVRMPRKATSFAPKPRMGVVMRDLDDA